MNGSKPEKPCPLTQFFKECDYEYLDLVWELVYGMTGKNKTLRLVHELDITNFGDVALARHRNKKCTTCPEAWGARQRTR